jgi:hypothetical protein
MTTILNANAAGIRLSFPDGFDLSKPVPIIVAAHRPSLWARLRRVLHKPNAYYVPAEDRLYPTMETAAHWQEWYTQKALEDTPEGREHKRAVHHAKRLLAATPVAASEYDSYVCDEDENYHATVEDLLDRADKGEEPAWCWATTEVPFDFDLEDAIASHVGDVHHEDAIDTLDLTPLLAFYAEWEKKQGLLSYYIDYKRVVVIDQARYDAEVAAAKALLA